MSFPSHPILLQAMRFYSGAIGWTFPVVQTISVSGTLPRKPAFIPAGNLSTPVHNLYLCLRHNPLLESDSGSAMLSRYLPRSFRYRSVPPQPPPFPPLFSPTPNFRISPHRNCNTATPRLYLYRNSLSHTIPAFLRRKSLSESDLDLWEKKLLISSCFSCNSVLLKPGE